MLKQLSSLTVEADGRYATDRELQFLKDYFTSVDQRISAYEKVRDAADTILAEMEAEKNVRNQTEKEKLFYIGSDDRSQTCLRDMRGILRCSAAAMLIDDLERMRQAVLLWYYTIVRAFGYEKDTEIMYRLLEKLVDKHLTEEEAELMKPILQLNYTILR
ncbi:allophycocyanin [Pleurocapsales cyanobacterium LEGE 06147]|nr:allophycocyanin [Pleurocapsales cyanobacterium LEGE 06147]